MRNRFWRDREPAPPLFPRRLTKDPSFGDQAVVNRNVYMWIGDRWAGSPTFIADITANLQQFMTAMNKLGRDRPWHLHVSANAERAHEGLLPVRKQTETIHAFKVARLVRATGGIRFQASTQAVTYGIDSHAVCTSLWLFDESKHEVPDPGCRCGFYGVEDAELIDPVCLLVRLDVEFFGRVIRHERGYRAERQRVLGVQVPHLCYVCLLPATVISVNVGGHFAATCDEHRSFAMTLRELSERLGGVDVRWLETSGKPSESR